MERRADARTPLEHIRPIIGRVLARLGVGAPKPAPPEPRRPAPVVKR